MFNKVRGAVMPTSTVTSKGQTTIPKEIRDHLHLKPGDRVEFVTDEDGRVVVLAATVDVAELAGMLKPPANPVSLEEMAQAVRKRGGRR
jgi:antitoxin PrlF